MIFSFGVTSPLFRQNTGGGGAGLPGSQLQTVSGTAAAALAFQMAPDIVDANMAAAVIFLTDGSQSPRHRQKW